MKKGKVLVTEYLKSYDYNGKTYYAHRIVLDNGDGGEYSSMSQDQNKFNVGEEVEYELTLGKEKQDGGRWPDKIKPASTGGGGSWSGGRKENPETNKSIQKQKALDVAERSVSNFKFESTKDYATNVLMVAARYYDWLSGKTEKEGKDLAESVKTGIPGVTTPEPEWVNS